MSPEQTEQLLQNIVDEVNQAGDLIGAFVPQVAAIMVIGKAVDKLIPGLVGDVERWLQGNPPTNEEKAATRAKILVLNDPNLP